LLTTDSDTDRNKQKVRLVTPTNLVVTVAVQDVAFLGYSPTRARRGRPNGDSLLPRSCFLPYSVGLGPPDRSVVLETLKRVGNDEAVSGPRAEQLSARKPGICKVNLTLMSDADWKQLARIAPRESFSTCMAIPRSIRTGSLILSDTATTNVQWPVPVATEPDHRNIKSKRIGEWNL
jgi:hypothetical protein